MLLISNTNGVTNGVTNVHPFYAPQNIVDIYLFILYNIYMKKICENCGKIFETNNKNKRFCCRRCKEKSKSKRIRLGIRYDNVEYTKVCIDCGKTFITKHYDKTRCDECKITHVRQTNREYYQTHKEYFKEYHKTYQQKRRKEDVEYKLKNNIHSRIYRALKRDGKSKQHRTLEYVDYTMGELKQHLESMFELDMTWENHGTLWHIDHIKPQASFKFVNEDGTENINAIKECWNLSNLQPLYIKDNLSKSSWYNGKYYRNGCVAEN